MITSSSPCACNSNRTYNNCCEPYLLGKNFPDTPEALMRSRYTAYTYANIDYIQETMRGPALTNFNPEATRQWASQVQWLDLKILSAPAVAPKANIGFVEFIASFAQQNHRHIIHEHSEFHRLDGRWYYINGRTPKVSRNSPCPCGSGKKFKQCCNNCCHS